MLFPDLSAPEAQPQKSLNNSKPIAAMADRFLALILDFLIFSPIVSLFVAGMVRQIKTFFLLNSSSTEGLIAAGLLAVMIVFFVTLLQTVFLFYWQATPGQFYLQLRVIPYPDKEGRLSLNQCFQRSLFWCFSFLPLAIPFLEIASHPLRRAFHERASDTMVVTLKSIPDDGPHPLESRFLSSWMRMSFLFLLLCGVLGFFKTYHSLQIGEYRESQTNRAACKEIKESEVTGASRLDAALSLYLLNEISSDCLDKEAEASLWNDPVNSQELAYLVKFVTTDGVDQEKYYKKVCEDSMSSLCALAHYLQDDGSSQDLEMADAKLWTTQVLLADEKYDARDFMGSLKAIESLQKVPVLKTALEKRYVRAVWALNEMNTVTPVQTMSQGRTPASATPDSPEKDSWLDSFKERYEVP